MLRDDENRGGGSPYRGYALLPEDPPRPRRRRIGRPVARALAAPTFVAAVVAAVPGFALGLLNGGARDRDEYIVPRMMRIEDAFALGLLAILPVLWGVLRWTTYRFPAPGALKQRYVRRHLRFYALVASVAATLACGLRPSTLPLLTSARSANGREAFVYRFWWGCGYDLWVADGSWTAKEVTWVAPFACTDPVPRLVWEGNSLTIVAANGETVGTWPADRSEQE